MNKCVLSITSVPLPCQQLQILEGVKGGECRRLDFSDSMVFGGTILGSKISIDAS